MIKFIFDKGLDTEYIFEVTDYIEVEGELKAQQTYSLDNVSKIVPNTFNLKSFMTLNIEYNNEELPVTKVYTEITGFSVHCNAKDNIYFYSLILQ